MEGNQNISENQVSHVLIFPFQSQGHINPMLQFSKRLASKGIRVSLITITSSNEPPQLPATSKINIEPIEFDEGDNISDHDEYFQLFTKLIPGKLATLIKKTKTSQNPAKFLVYDSFMPWVLGVARGVGVDGAPFFTQSWAVNTIYYHLQVGTFRVPLEESFVSLPSVPLLEGSDLPSLVQDTSDAYRGFRHMLTTQFADFGEAKWVFANSFDKLEDEIIMEWVSRKIPIKTIGPTIPSMYLDKRLADDNDYDLNLFEPNVDACIEWLDSKQPGSVLYVSFGSLAAVGEEQMEEIARGLKESDKYFLWVVRETEKNKLPSKFVEETLEKGLVVSWCPQLRVLAHEAVGGFMTHCGWNSTLEALSLGVPMVTMPQWIDQPTNAKFVEDVWKVGVRVRVNEKGIVKKEEIERCLKEVMEGERSIEMKRNSAKWKKLSREAVDEGGSSDKNIKEFVAHLMIK